MGRAPCCEKVGLKKGRWTKEEDEITGGARILKKTLIGPPLSWLLAPPLDEILARYIEEHGEGSWRTLPKNAGLLRCGKSCRLRWINYLRADLKRGNISADEEEMIMKLHATLGNRWSLIAGHLPGRTDNEIKNYWNSHLSKKASDFRNRGGDDGVVVNVDLSKLPGGGKRRGGRMSRGGAARGAKEKKVKAKGKEKAPPLHHQEEDTNMPTPSSSQPCSARSEEQAPQASASGVTSDGLEDGPLGLSEEMVSGLLGPASPKLEALELDHDVDSGSGPSAHHQSGGGPAGDVAVQELMGDKALQQLEQDWDLTGLDIPVVDDDMWDSLVWTCDDMVMAPEVGQQGEVVPEPDMFFLDENLL